MKKPLFALLALVLLLTGCPTHPAPEVDASAFEAGLAVDAAIDAAPHRLGSFNPTCTGTGLPKVVSGVQTSACATVVNADVNAAAAIAGTKIAPDFGAQNIVTTGALGLGAAPASAGDVRLSVGGTVANHDSATGYYVLVSGVGDNVYVGTDSSFAHQSSGLNIYSSNSVALGVTSSTYQYLSGGNNEVWKPMTGSALGSTPFSVHGDVTDATVGTFTIAAASYKYDIIRLTGGTAGTVTFPAAGTNGAYYKTIINTSGVIKTLTDGGATTQPFGTGFTARFLFDTTGVHLASASTAYP